MASFPGHRGRGVLAAVAAVAVPAGVNNGGPVYPVGHHTAAGR